MLYFLQNSCSATCSFEIRTSRNKFNSLPLKKKEHKKMYNGDGSHVKRIDCLLHHLELGDGVKR